jgi:hypothetical protein
VREGGEEGEEEHQDGEGGWRPHFSRSCSLVEVVGWRMGVVVM